MPATAEAAEVTANYRRQLLAIRDQLVRVIALQLRGIDFDGDLERQIRAWTEDATGTVELGQREVARLASLYVPAYLTASGVEPDPVDPLDVDRYAGRTPFGRQVQASLAMAPGAMLWRLGRGDGRNVAVTSGVARATRVTRTAVMGAAREAQTDAMAPQRQILGWRRVTSARPCGACLTAADGTLHGRRRAFARFHDSCRCTAEPAIRGLPERYRRPTGQELFDSLDENEQAGLFAGMGGADKAAIVRERGVAVLADERGGQLTETRMSDLT